MASVGVVPSAGLREPSGQPADVDRLPEEMNDMKIRDDKVCHPLVQFSTFSVLFGCLIMSFRWFNF